MGQPTLILTQTDLRRLVTRSDYPQSVEEGFSASAEGRASSPLPLHVEADLGGLCSGDDEIIVLDSTGTAIEDVARAAAAYEPAVGSDVASIELADV